MENDNNDQHFQVVFWSLNNIKYYKIISILEEIIIGDDVIDS